MRRQHVRVVVCDKLGFSRACLILLLDMRLCRFRSVVHCMLMMTTSEVCMMSGSLMFARFMVFSGFLVVSCRMFVMFRCLVMMFGCLFRHISPRCELL
jgi:hypothetical protein